MGNILCRAVRTVLGWCSPCRLWMWFQGSQKKRTELADNDRTIPDDVCKDMVELNFLKQNSCSVLSKLNNVEEKITSICLTTKAILCHEDRKRSDVYTIQGRDKHVQTEKNLPESEETRHFLIQEDDNGSDIQTIEERNESFEPIRKLAKDVEALTAAFEQLKALFVQQKTHGDIYIVDASPSDASSRFVSALRIKLLNDSIIVNLMDTLYQIEETDENSTILIVCSLTSRFESNLNILKDIDQKHHQRIVLILLNCTDITNLKKSQIGEAKKRFPLFNKIVEMAFTDDIYKCTMNSVAWKDLNCLLKN